MVCPDFAVALTNNEVGFSRDVIAAARALVMDAVMMGTKLAGSGGTEAIVASICHVLSLDPTLVPDMSASTTGRLQARMWRLSSTSLRDDVLGAEGSGSIHIITSTAASPAVPVVLSCIESGLPEQIEAALEAAGVEMDVARSM